MTFVTVRISDLYDQVPATLALDGAYRIGADGQPRFVAAAAPAPARLQAPLAEMIARLMRLFVRRGAVAAEPDRIWI